MRESMARLTPQYSSNRMLREYLEKLYLPAAASLAKRQAKDALSNIVVWEQTLRTHWQDLSFRTVETRATEGEIHFVLTAKLGPIPPDSIRVQLFANGLRSDAPEIHVMTLQAGEGIPQGGEYRYAAIIKTNRPAADYTPRIIPYHPGVSVPIECGHILWYR